MRTTIVWRMMAVTTVFVALSAQGQAQPAQPKLEGLIHHYTATLGAGPWQIVGEWSLGLRGESGKVDFFAAVSMVRSDSTPRSAHTHHITLSEANVTQLANGYRISGNATFTSDGSVAGFSGSAVDIEITGGAAVPAANMTLTVHGAAANHFGPDPITGVVTYRR